MNDAIPQIWPATGDLDLASLPQLEDMTEGMFMFGELPGEYVAEMLAKKGTPAD